MKNTFIIGVFLLFWGLTAAYLIHLDWWQPYLYRSIGWGVAIMVGMSISASVAIILLNLTDWVLDKILVIETDNNIITPIKN
ncbi:hypothetical protein [Tellurirhabdus bombi]|uniref:hypothetical protein n=1 Tax=Tellurirhabdus bombi TaxID=2907205 RepID=UPI001F44C376|nr:hypothetical protein [Tellurirhabdus bombi]